MENPFKDIAVTTEGVVRKRPGVRVRVLGDPANEEKARLKRVRKADKRRRDAVHRAIGQAANFERLKYG